MNNEPTPSPDPSDGVRAIHRPAPIGHPIPPSPGRTPAHSLTKRKPQPSTLAPAVHPAIAANAADEISGWLLLVGELSGIEELFDLPEAVSAAAADLAVAHEVYNWGLDCPHSPQERQLATDLCEALDEGDHQAASALADQLADLAESESSRYGYDPEGERRPRPTFAEVEAKARQAKAAMEEDEAQQRRCNEAKERLSIACQGWEEAEAAIPLLHLSWIVTTGDLGILHVSTDAHWWHRAAVEAMDDGIPAERISAYCIEKTGRPLDGDAADALAQYEATREGEDKKAAARARCWADLLLYWHFATGRQGPRFLDAEQEKRQALSARSRELIRTGQIKAGDTFQVRVSGHDRAAEVVETRLAKVVLSFHYKNGKAGTKTVYAAALLPAEVE